jgi:prepilin-type N-terminal cleavage/methylation domain-containing protein
MRSPRRQGFTLVECIVSLLILGFLFAGFYSLLAAAFSSSQLPSFTVNGTVYAKAPDIGQMNAAINAQVLFQKLQQNADSVLVFGGKGTHPTSDPTGPSNVINWSSWPTAPGSELTWPGFDPARQFTSWGQQSLVPGGLVSPVPGSTADFSVVFIKGFNQISGIAKQQMLTATLNGSQVHCYDVEVRDFNYGTTGTVSTQEFDYHVYYPAGEDAWRVAPGATHAWFRYDTQWDRLEEAGAFLVFADPYVVAGENPDPQAAEVLPVSEFSFYVPVVN